MGAKVNCADLSAAYLERANLTRAVFDDATLANFDLRFVVAAETSFRRADLTGCHIYGISVWNAVLEGAQQRDLVITPPNENPVTTDNFQIAQFLFLLLKNRSIRDVIETVGKKAVLILGRFTDERKPILERIRDELRATGLIPILFDFAGPSNRDITETVSTLAHLSRAVIADITDSQSVPQELMAIVPNLPSVRVLPIVAKGHNAYVMFEHLCRFPWVHQTFAYASSDEVCRWITDELRNASST